MVKRTTENDVRQLKKKAEACFFNQKKRCENPTDKSYKYYGHKGVRVLYKKDEFISWWIKNFLKFDGKRPTVGRKNHAKDYSLDNIEMQDQHDNCIKENIQRNGHPSIKRRRSILILDYKTMEPLMIAKTQRECARLTGVSGGNVHSVIKNTRGSKQGKGYTFIFYKGTM